MKLTRPSLRYVYRAHIFPAETPGARMKVNDRIISIVSEINDVGGIR